LSFVVRKAGLSGLPLGLVPAVVIDTETTGLDTASDRIIEMAAVRISNGRADTANPFAALIDPQVPIPAGSTAIHTITDADVAGAESFKEVMPRFSAWTGNGVVIGYSIGFDLGILKTEHHRNGLKWNPPRSLDVRHLMQIVAPELPEQSLDTAAGWLDIEIEGRHRALTDAILALKVFQALLPRLKDKGITTLSQAERACLARPSQRQGEVQAGWHDVVLPERTVPASISDYARIDSYPYRHRVADVMHTPPLTVAGNWPVSKALAMVMERKVSSVFVEPVPQGGAFGILTERDILRGIAAHGAKALQMPAEMLATFPLESIGADEFVYRAISTMAGGGFRHLGVTGTDGELTGALSARDLLKQRSGGAVLLGDSIDAAGSAAELGKIWSGLTTVVRGLVAEDVDARDIASVVSRELCALTGRACQLAETAMAAEGLGAPPQPYAMFVLGSGGRGESLLAMDQDNALVFEQGEPGGEADAWFAQLGKRVSDTLNDAGVVYCKGGIMAANAEWRMDSTHWRDVVSGWLTKSRPEDILNSDIFFDAKAVAGDARLVDGLRRDALDAAGRAQGFLRAMELRAGEFQSPTGWLGKLKLEDGRVDLKKAGLMPLFSAARVLALQHGLAERSTPDRFTAARKMGIQAAHVIDELIDAHRILLSTILRQQLRDIEAGLALGNSVDPKQLDGHDLQQMRWAIDQVPKVRDLFGLPVLG